MPFFLFHLLPGPAHLTFCSVSPPTGPIFILILPFSFPTYSAILSSLFLPVLFLNSASNMTSFRSYLPHSYQSCRLPGSSLSPDSKWTYLLLFLLLLSSVLTFSTVFLADLSSSISTVITALICPLYDPIGPTFLLVLSSQFCLPSDILAFLPTFSTFRRVLPCSQVLLQPDDLLFLLSPRSYLLPDLSVSTFFMVPDGLPPT